LIYFMLESATKAVCFFNQSKDKLQRSLTK